MRSPLEQELRALLGDGRNADIAADYCGLDGRAGSLRRVARDSGLSHETVRTIVRGISRKLSTSRPSTPILDRTIDSVASFMPGTAREIEAALRSQKLTSDLFCVQSVVLLSRLLGKDLPFSVARIRGELLVQPRDRCPVDTVVRAAKRLAARRGVISVSDVTQTLSCREEGITEDSVRRALQSCRRFDPVDDEKTWFSLSAGRRENPLTSRTRKILSVAKQVRVSDAKRAILRGYKLKEFSIPCDILINFFRTLPGLTVSDNTVAAVPEIDPECVLSPIERHFVSVLEAYDGIMPRDLFLNRCQALGVKPGTMMQHMTYSPLIVRHGEGLYGLIGVGSGSQASGYRG